MINETLARKLWGRTDAVGESLVIDAGPAKRAAYRVVGVSQDFRASLRRAPEPEVYIASAQAPSPMKFVVRSSLPPEAVTARIRQVVLAEDPTLPVTGVVTMRGLVWEGTVFERFHTVLLTAFGFCAALIAVSGIVAVIMYAVAGRTREIGIRLAVGATPPQVVRLLVKEITPAVILGLTAGLFAIYNLAYLLKQQGLLFEVSAFHPTIYAGVTVALLVVGTVAAWLPARRAGRIEPTVALRSN